MRKLIPCLLILLTLLSGCSEAPSPTQTPEPPAVAPVINESPSAPVESPEPSKPEYPTLANVSELSDYLNLQVEQGISDISFIYSGNSTRINEQTLIEILSALHIDIQRDPANRKLFHISVTGFPGDRIAAAHRSGDTSSLSPDELQVLELARQMVAEAQAASTFPLELERTLHDMLMERVEYCEYDVKPHDP
ncbi:MAG: hypothetical protein IJX71_02530, partial [Oscillospiraceae bacterium]|nr:hypothetical protein [Oscillospiraceae bacterium]